MQISELGRVHGDKICDTQLKQYRTKNSSSMFHVLRDFLCNGTLEWADWLLRRRITVLKQQRNKTWRAKHFPSKLWFSYHTSSTKLSEKERTYVSLKNAGQLCSTNCQKKPWIHRNDVSPLPPWQKQWDNEHRGPVLKIWVCCKRRN